MTSETLAIINAALTLGLVVLTGAYVFLTHRLVQETRKASQESRDLLATQSRLAFFPHISCRVLLRDGRIVIQISNPSEHPAYDADVYTIVSYSEDDIDLPTFITKYVQEKHKKERVALTDEGFYGVYDHFVYPDFPSRKRVEAELRVPQRPGTVYVLVQYRDLSGLNYVQTCWFFQDKLPARQEVFRLGSLSPEFPKPVPRVEREIDGDYGLKVADGSDIGAVVNSEFVDLFSSSISSGLLKGAVCEVEDRGTWSDVS